MSFLKKSIPVFFFISFFGIGASLFVTDASAAIGDSCVGNIPTNISGQPPITGTGTCQTVGSTACNPVTMNVAPLASCGAAPVFCCFPKVVTPPPTSCTYLGGSCVQSAASCSATVPGATSGCLFGNGEVCCKTGALITPGTPACTSVSGQSCLPSCGGATPNPKSGFICATGVCCGPASGSGTPVPAGSGTPVPGTPTSITITNPLAFDTVEGVLGSLLGTLRGIIVVLSLVFIVLGAVLYVTSAGNEGRMKTAKGAITASMIGLAIGIAAPSFLKQIGDVLGWGPVSSSLPAGTRTLTEIALSVLQFLLSVVGVLGIIMLVIGGLTYITAAGDEHRIDTGKKIVTYAIIGIAVALSALIVVTQIAKLFV